MGTFQARPSPAGDHFSGRPFSVDWPSRAGPRHSGQLFADSAPPASMTLPARAPAKRTIGMVRDAKRPGAFDDGAARSDGFQRQHGRADSVARIFGT